MMENNVEKELLTELCRLAACPYLSDLHNHYYFNGVLKALNKIEASAYSLDQWRVAYRYITGDSEPGKTEKEMIQKLILFLESKSE